jgi:hypothetical protein
VTAETDDQTIARSYQKPRLAVNSFHAALLPKRHAMEMFGLVFGQHDSLAEALQPVTLQLPHEYILEGERGLVQRLASAGRPV